MTSWTGMRRRNRIAGGDGQWELGAKQGLSGDEVTVRFRGNEGVGPEYGPASMTGIPPGMLCVLVLAAVALSLGACRKSHSRTGSPTRGTKDAQRTAPASRSSARPSRQPVALEAALVRQVPGNTALLVVLDARAPWRLAGATQLPEELRAMVRSRLGGTKGPGALGLDRKQPFALALSVAGAVSDLKSLTRLTVGDLSRLKDKALVAVRLRYIAKVSDRGLAEKYLAGLVSLGQAPGKTGAKQSNGWSCRYRMADDEALVGCLKGHVLVIDELERAAGRFTEDQLVAELQAAGSSSGSGKGGTARPGHGMSGTGKGGGRQDGRGQAGRRKGGQGKDQAGGGKGATVLAGTDWRGTFVPVAQARADASALLLPRALGRIALVHGLTQIVGALKAASPEERQSLLTVGMSVARIPYVLAHLDAAFDRCGILVDTRKPEIVLSWHGTKAGVTMFQQVFGEVKAGTYDSLASFRAGFLASLRKAALAVLPKSPQWDAGRHRKDLERGGVFALLVTLASQWPRVLTDGAMVETLAQFLAPVWAVMQRAFGVRKVTVERKGTDGLRLRIHH